MTDKKLAEEFYMVSGMEQDQRSVLRRHAKEWLNEIFNKGSVQSCDDYHVWIKQNENNLMQRFKEVCVSEIINKYGDKPDKLKASIEYYKGLAACEKEMKENLRIQIFQLNNEMRKEVMEKFIK